MGLYDHMKTYEERGHPPISWKTIGYSALAAGIGIATITGIAAIETVQEEKSAQELAQKVKSAPIYRVKAKPGATIEGWWIREGYSHDNINYGIALYQALNANKFPRAGEDMTLLNLKADIDFSKVRTQIMPERSKLVEAIREQLKDRARFARTDKIQ